jgi:hypothetical protein
MNRAYKDMNSALKGLTAEQARLNAELLKAKEGTKAYKTLESALDSVEKKSKQLTRTLKAMKPDPGGGLQGFAQGFAPRVAGFIQRGPGMRSQMAGQFAGAAARTPFRAAGRAGMNVGGMMTGGGIGTLLQGIPFAGGLAAMAEGAVGQANAREQALLQAMLTTGGLGGVGAARAGAIKGAAQGAGGRIDVEALSILRGKQDEQEAKRAGYEQEASAQIRARGLNDPKRAAAERFRRLSRPDDFRPANVTQIYPVDDEAKDLASRRLGREYAGAGAAATAQANANERARQQTAGNQAARKAMLDPWMGAIGALKNMGMDKTQAIQFASQMTGQIGGGAISAAGVETIVGAQTRGVQAGTSARLLRQMRSGRGGQGGDASNVIAHAIGEAVAMGLEGSEINEHLSHIASLQERAEQQGLKISVEGAGGIARAMGALGAQGPRAATLAGQFAAASQRAGIQGISGTPVSSALFRSAGFDPTKGGLSYLRAGRRLQKLASGKADPDVLFNFIENLTGGIRGRSEEQNLLRGNTLQKNFAQLGVTIGPDEADAMAEAVRAGRGGFEERFAKSGAAASFLSGGKLRGAAGGADLAAATRLARMQSLTSNKLVEAGNKIAPTVNALNRNAAALSSGVAGLLAPVQEFLPMMTRLTTTVEKVLNKLGEEGQSLVRDGTVSQ